MRRLLLVAVFLVHALSFAQENAVEKAIDVAGEKTGEHVAEAEKNELPNEIWWKWANFGILVAALGYLVAKNAGPYFVSRSSEIQKGIAEANAVKAEAEARAAAIEARIANLSGEIETIRKSSHEEIEAEGARISAETARSIAKVQAHAEQEIASAVKNASLGLKAHAAELAIALAGQQIRDRMSPQVQDQLVHAFVQELAQESKAKAALN